MFQKLQYLELPQKHLASTVNINMITVVHLYVRKNINCSISESLDRFEAVCNAAIAKQIPVRG